MCADAMTVVLMRASTLFRLFFSAVDPEYHEARMKRALPPCAVVQCHTSRGVPAVG